MSKLTYKIGDCLQLLPEIPDKSIDMILTDPPYLTTDLDFDRIVFDFPTFIIEANRILKDNGWFFTFGTIEIAKQILDTKLFVRKFEYIWIKSALVPKTHNTIRPFYQHELLFAFIKSSLKCPTKLPFFPENLKKNGERYTKKMNSLAGEFATKNRLHPIIEGGFQNNYIVVNMGFREGTTILFYPEKTRMSYDERTSHPTQKPLKLFELIVSGYSFENAVICDPFLGSGTTLEACASLNRNCIGFEILNNWEYHYKEIINQVRL